MKNIGRYSFVFGAAETTVSQIIAGLNGKQHTICLVVVAIPNWTNNVTLTYAHVLLTTAPVYSIAGLARNQPITAPVLLLYERPIYDGCVLSLTLSGAPGAGGGTVTADLFVEN